MSPDPMLELRRRKQAAATELLRAKGRSAFRVIRSAEAAPISYNEMSPEDLPRPASESGGKS